MKRLITLGISLAVALLVLASTALPGDTGKIRGTVTDAETGDPLPFVTVQLESTTMGTLTDQNGEYTIINVPPGKYTLIVKLTGFEVKKVTNLTVAAGGTVVQDFVLEPVKADSKIDQIPVIAVPAEETAFDREYGNATGAIAPSTVNPSVLKYCGPQDRSLPRRLPAGYPMAHGGNTPPNGEPFDAMFFDHTGVNPFVSTEDDHLSTFAIDVDNASYTMTRSYLNRGFLPPDDAVRVEEFVNNFNYEYRHPQEQAFDVVMEGAPSPFGQNYRMLKIAIVGKKISDENRKDANLLFVIDVSGSMGREDRLGLVRKSLRMLVDNLSERDRVGIVVYGSNAWVVLEPTSLRDKDRIYEAIGQLYPSGSTNAEQGIRLGYEMAERNFAPGKINRVILCSDGVANNGLTAAEDLLKMIKRQSDKGITLSTIGFGMGNYNDILMEKLGNKGNGHYAYVDSWDESRRVFMENLTGMLQVIARDVKIQVDFDPDKVDRYRLLGYENRDIDDDKFRDDKEDGGEIGSGHQVTALYEVKLKPGAGGELGRVYVRFKDPDSFDVTEVSEPLNRNLFKSTFEQTSTDFKLAAAAADFAEILRNSYWAKEGKLSAVLDLARQVERERSTAEVIELMDLISKADRFKQQQEVEDELLSEK
jgi:Ca-activated chloride channel family protein